jgi:hypothetical protein
MTGCLKRDEIYTDGNDNIMRLQLSFLFPYCNAYNTGRTSHELGILRLLILFWDVHTQQGMQTPETVLLQGAVRGSGYGVANVLL